MWFSTHVRPGVGITVRVDGGHEVEVYVVQQTTVAGDQLLDEVVDGGGRDPFTGVDTWKQGIRKYLLLVHTA